MRLKSTGGGEGYGWFSHNGNAVFNAYDRLDVIPESVLEADGTYDVTYTLDFNKDRNPAAFSGRPWFFVYLPAALQDDSIRITRMREETNFGIGGVKYNWTTVASEQTIGQFHDGSLTSTRKSYVYPEEGFQNDWANGVNSTDNLKGKETVCSVTKWKNDGKFARSLWSYEKEDNVKHKWVITGKLKKGFDPILQPIVAGYTSSNTIGWDNLFAAYGPYDTDGDGVPDTKELALGTNQTVTGDHIYEEKTVKANQMSSSAVAVKTGSFDRTNGKFTYDADNASKPLSEFNGIGRSLDQASLPQGVSVTQSKTPKPGEVYFDGQTAELIFNPADMHKGKKIDFTVNFTYEPRDHCSAAQAETVTATFNVQEDPAVKNAVVTFMNENTLYKTVQVEKGKAIATDNLPDESMPSNPAKAGYTFLGWSLTASGDGPIFTENTQVNEDITVYAAYRNTPPVLEVESATIAVGDELDVKSLITKASDAEDGDDLKDTVVIDKGGFDKDTVGSYTVTFTLTDQGGVSVTKQATVTVNPKIAPLNQAPVLEVESATITVGDELDVKSLITKASDAEDGDDLKDTVVIDKGGFDKDTVGSYTVTFTLTDQGGVSVTKQATVTVNPKIAKQPEKVCSMPETGDSTSLGMFAAAVSVSLAGIAILRKKRAAVKS